MIACSLWGSYLNIYLKPNYINIYVKLRKLETVNKAK
jgi:hypothetical protein